MDELTRRFEESRGHLRSVAFRMLGSASEAEDAVQEAWLRLRRSDTSAVDNLRGWLTTVVARVCLDALRSRKSRREEPLADHSPIGDDAGADREALLADSIGPALLVVLDTLGPAERVAFVLHDLFALPFEEIAPIVGRSPAAARQLASRARRRVQGGPVPEGDRDRQRQVVGAFLAASRGGDFDALLALLDPEVVLRADALALQVAAANLAHGAPPLAAEIRGAEAVAETFRGRARTARVALIDGAAGAAWVQGAQVRSVFVFAVENGKIVDIDLIMEPARLGELEVIVER